MRFFYSLSVYALMAVLFGYFFWRGFKEPAYRHRWAERLGYVGEVTPDAIWIHAASVGEVQAVTPLVTALLRHASATRLLITTFTPTGAGLVESRINSSWGGRVQHRYLPLDTPSAVRRFLTAVQPQRCLIVETELWPNLLSGCQQHGVPVSLVSATISERSLARYRAFPANKLLPPVLGVVDRVLAQTAEEAARFAQLGVEAARIEVVGNMKFDYTPPPTVYENAQQLRKTWHACERPVWLAASTHEGEEQMVLEAFAALKADIHDLLLVLVPRHLQRFERAYKLCRERHLSVSRYSRKDQVDDETEVVLGDTLGDQLMFMALADVVFVGGSLVPVGGHNLLEPAALQKAVISGPYTESQAQLRDLLLANEAYLEVRGAKELHQAVKSLFDLPNLRQEKGQAALAVVNENQGVVSRVMEFIATE